MVAEAVGMEKKNRGGRGLQLSSYLLVEPKRGGGCLLTSPRRGLQLYIVE